MIVSKSIAIIKKFIFTGSHLGYSDDHNTTLAYIIESKSDYRLVMNPDIFC